MSTLPQLVADKAARAVTMPLVDWLLINPGSILFQPKYDGTRIWVVKTGNSVVCATKHDRAYTSEDYPELGTLRASKHTKLILDCEFLKQEHVIKVFDVLHIGTEDCSHLPLAERVARLEKLQLGEITGGKFVPAISVPISGINAINKAKEEAIAAGFEGIVVKNARSRYYDKNAWLKLKKFDTFDVWVTGRDFSHEGPTYYISCYNPGGQIVDLGKVGSFVKGIDHTMIKEGAVLEIQFQETTKDKRLRHPFALKIRTDKVKEECINQI